MKVLITLEDVEPAVRLNAALERLGMQTDLVSPLDDIRAGIRRERPDLIVFSGALRDANTIAILKEQLWEGTPAVGLSDVADPEHVERFRGMGFVEVYPKPIDVDDVAESLRRLLERRALQETTGLIGESEALREVMVQIEQMAPVSSTVLIEGESGTGKELVARALARLSPRRNKPFIAVNVGALPETLVESELFGHEKGAFTGAAERRLGRFELANDGTLFLDEIGEIPKHTQVKLLRVLEGLEFMRLGGTHPITVNVRVVAATNQPLRELAERGEFRSDLFYRLNVLRIYLPPLRERREDIPLLVRRFVKDYSKRHDRAFLGISAEAMQKLVEYPWPGNVRELRNLVESMVVLSPGHEIQPDDLPRQIREGASARFLPVHVGPVVQQQDAMVGHELEFIMRSLIELKLQVEELRRREGLGGPSAGTLGNAEWIGNARVLGPAGNGAHAADARAEAIEAPGSAPPPNLLTFRPGTKLADIEKAAIEAALKEKQGNRRLAAELLGIGERTLYRKIKEYRLPEGTTS